MKLKITLLLLMSLIAGLTQAQTTLTSEITATTLRETFTGTYGGNPYCCGGIPTTYTSVAGTNMSAYLDFINGNFMTVNTVLGSRLYLTHSTATENGTVSGSMIDMLDMIAVTPALATYDGVGHAQSTFFDSRYFLIYAFYGNVSAGTDPGLDITSNKYFSVKVKNYESVPALVRFSFAAGFVNTGCCVSESGSAYVFTVPGNTTMYLSQALSINQVKAVKIQTANFEGRISFDDLRLGYALPNTFSLVAAGGATTVAPGNTLQFLASTNSSEYDSTTVYSVTNSSAGATSIDGTGLLTVSPTAAIGPVTVTAFSPYNNVQTKTIVINVAPPVAATGVTINGLDTIYVGNATYTYTATVLPSDAANKTITKLTSTTIPGVLAIPSATGILLKASSSGVVIITGYHVEGSTTITGTKTVHIVATVTGVTSITGPSIVTIGGVVGTYTGSTLPSDAINGGLTWSVSPSAKATISSDGILSPILPGAVTITGTAIANASLSKSIAVTIISVPGLGSTGLNVSELSTSITVYPNPVSDVLSISFSGVVSSVIVFNTVGTQVAAGTGNNISLASLPEGFYTVEIVTNLGTVFKSIIKTK